VKLIGGGYQPPSIIEIAHTLGIAVQTTSSRIVRREGPRQPEGAEVDLKARTRAPRRRDRTKDLGLPYKMLYYNITRSLHRRYPIEK
jgi:hypothetical protein